MLLPLLLLTFLFSPSLSTFILPYTLPLDLIQLMGTLEQPANSTNFICDDVILEYCQTTFNSKMGWGEGISWRNGTWMMGQIQTSLDASQDKFFATCGYHSTFHQCMGTYYDTCLNLYSLLSRIHSDLQNTFDYLRTFRSLEYICNDGSDAVIGKWGCLGAVPQTSTYKMCTSSFQRAVNSNNLCLSVNQTASCMSDAFNAACGTGSYGCNNFISEFNTACNGLTC